MLPAVFGEGEHNAPLILDDTGWNLFEHNADKNVDRLRKTAHLLDFRDNKGICAHELSLLFLLFS
jgi:hypothetical protein